MAAQKVLSLAFAFLALALPASAASGRRPETIPKFVGSVSAINANWFLGAVADRTDKIVGLKIYVEPSTEEGFKKTRYIAEADEDQFVLSKSNIGGAGVEMVAPKAEARWEHGGYVLDGFYVVKSGGIHQGTISVGLEKVRESDVLLSSKFRVVTKALVAADPQKPPPK